MTPRHFWIPFLLICLLLTPPLVQAQDSDLELSENFSTEDGQLRFDYPEGWATCDCAPGLSYLYNDPELDLQFANPETLERGQVVFAILTALGTQSLGWDFGPLDEMSAEEIIQSLLEMTNIPEDFAEPESFEIGDRLAAKIAIPDSGLEFWAFEAAPRRNLLILVSTPPADEGDYQDLLLSVLASLDYGEELEAGQGDGTAYRFPNSDLYMAYSPNWQVIDSDTGPAMFDLQGGSTLLLTAAPVETFPDGADTDWAEVANKGVEWADMLSGSEVIPAEEIEIGEWPAWAAYILSDGSYTLYLVIKVDEEYILTILVVSSEEEAVLAAAERISEDLSFYVE